MSVDYFEEEVDNFGGEKSFQKFKKKDRKFRDRDEGNEFQNQNKNVFVCRKHGLRTNKIPKDGVCPLCRKEERDW